MVRRKLSCLWIDSMSLEEAERLMAQAMDIQKIRTDIIRREQYMEEYLKDNPNLKEFYRTDEEIYQTAMRASLIESQKLINQANQKKNI